MDTFLCLPKKLWHYETSKETIVIVPLPSNNKCLWTIRICLQNVKTPSDLIQNGDTSLHLRLLHLFNICWTNPDVPDEWRLAKVVPFILRSTVQNRKNRKVQRYSPSKCCLQTTTIVLMTFSAWNKLYRSAENLM